MAYVGQRWLIAQRALVRIMDERSWVLKMGKEDGISVGRIYDGVGRLGTWGLGRQVGSAEKVGRNWAGELGLWGRGSEAWVRGVG